MMHYRMLVICSLVMLRNIHPSDPLLCSEMYKSVTQTRNSSGIMSCYGIRREIIPIRFSLNYKSCQFTPNSPHLHLTKLSCQLNFIWFILCKFLSCLVKLVEIRMNPLFSYAGDLAWELQRGCLAGWHQYSPQGHVRYGVIKRGN